MPASVSTPEDLEKLEARLRSEFSKLSSTSIDGGTPFDVEETVHDGGTP